MPKVILMKNRNEGVELDEFKDHMLGERMEEIKRSPGIERYVLSFPSDVGDAPFDSVEEMYFDSEADMRAAFESEAADRAHEKGVDVVDFENERTVVVEAALELELEG